MRRWLLVTAVWLFGVAGLWRWLPPAPRYALRLPATAGDVMVTPGGVAVITGEKVDPFSIFSRNRGPLAAWDITSGRRLWTDYGPDDQLSAGLSGDGTRVWSVRKPDPLTTRVAATGERLPPDAPRFDGRRVVFPGERTVLVATEQQGRFDLYERAGERQVGTLPADGGVAVGRSFGQFGGDDGVVISADGRRAAMAVREPRELHVYDLGTAALVARLPRGEDETPYALLAGGEVVLSDGTVRLASSGQAVFTLPDTGHDFPILPADDRWVVMGHEGPDGAWLTWHDALTGREDVGRRFTLTAEPTFLQAWSPKPAGDRPIERGGRWVWCKADWSRPAGAVSRLLGQLPGLGFLADDAESGRCCLLDGGTGEVVVELSGVGYEFLHVTDDGRLYTRNGEWVQVWDTRRRPSLRLLATLAAGWAAGLAGVCHWFARVRPDTPAIRP